MIQLGPPSMWWKEENRKQLTSTNIFQVSLCLALLGSLALGSSTLGRPETEKSIPFWQEGRNEGESEK